MHLRMTLDIHIDTNGVPADFPIRQKLAENLTYMVQHAIAAGWITGDSEQAEQFGLASCESDVERHTVRVEEITEIGLEGGNGQENKSN